DAPPPVAYAPEVEETAEPPPEPAPSRPEGGRVECNGVGLLALAEGLLAVSLALQLVVALIQLATADSSPRTFTTKPGSSFAASFAELLTLVWVVTQVG